jgi:hypothetical protein
VIAFRKTAGCPLSAELSAVAEMREPDLETIDAEGDRKLGGGR